ncbi:MAG: hypothetical protein GY874_08825 [Desulfobacteraceae bacterium]|nr:hypothetical protein [Desulfobacteraceae bacterium]
MAHDIHPMIKNSVLSDLIRQGVSTSLVVDIQFNQYESFEYNRGRSRRIIKRFFTAYGVTGNKLGRVNGADVGLADIVKPSGSAL